MIIRLIIRHGERPGKVRISTDFKVESKDTPNINNLGMEILEQFKGLCGECKLKMETNQ